MMENEIAKRNNIDDFISEISERTQLKEGKSIIERALHYVHFHGSTSNRLLSKELQIPIPVASAIKKECIKLGIWKQDAGIRPTDKGRDFFLQYCGYDGIDESLYVDLMANEEKRIQFIEELCSVYKPIYEQRPSVDVTIDQAKCTIETAFSRAVLCLTNYSLIGKKVLCVGDDDLVSIAL